MAVHYRRIFCLASCESSDFMTYCRGSVEEQTKSMAGSHGPTTRAETIEHELGKMHGFACRFETQDDFGL